MTTVLLVDDEASVRFTAAEVLIERGHTVIEASGVDDALTKLDEADVVVTDLAMPGLDGFALLERVRSTHPELPVIVLTARGSERAAVRAMKSGAFDYLAKPYDIDELSLSVERAAEVSSLRRRSRHHDAERLIGRPVLGDSPAFRAVIERTIKIARHDVSTLVTGETGTGKELIASLLHAASKRSSGPLVRFNCAAIPAELAESELFGHERGAFTGATAKRNGYFTEAHGGTLVLDEVAELPLGVQAKLLRATQGGEVQPLGSVRAQRVDVRVVSCTHRDLQQAVARGQFREDLYYRLAVVTLHVPALRERGDDVALLARSFAARAAERCGLERVTLTDALVRELCKRPWAGNVRQLENAMTAMVAMSESTVLDVGSLAIDAATTKGSGTFRAQVERLERALLTEALAESEGNQSEAARRLGLSRVTMLDRLKRYGLL